MPQRCEQSQDGALCPEWTRARSKTHQKQRQVGGALGAGAREKGGGEWVQIKVLGLKSDLSLFIFTEANIKLSSSL